MTGEESFLNSNSNLRLANFWQWAYSDLLSNTTRGILAEFIVQSALDEATKQRTEWARYDISYRGLGIEVKSAAYVQSWKQKQASKIIFDIAPKKAYSDENNKYAAEAIRQAEIYVFCLLDWPEKEGCNPLDLSQWIFYVLPTATINAELKLQKRLSFSTLKGLKSMEAKYLTLKNSVDKIIDMINQP